MRKKAGGFNMKIVLRILFLYKCVFVHSRALVLFGWTIYVRPNAIFILKKDQQRSNHHIFTSNEYVAYNL